MESISQIQQEKQQLSKKQLGKLKDAINKYEWTHELDSFLLDSVVRNYFNFDMVSLELNEETKRLNLYFGATHSFTNEKCRIRWSYLHMKRLQEKEIRYKTLPYRVSVPEQQSQQLHEDENKPNKTLKLHGKPTKLVSTSTQSNSSHHSSQTQRASIAQSRNNPLIESEPQKLLSSKTFENITQMREPKSLGDIEKEIWKKNITFQSRKSKDYLDVSNEDFSNNKTFSSDGKEITPSNFNIFRDSLRQTSEKLLQTLQENLPDVNLKEIEQEPSEEEEDEEDDVLPLDFRTALIEGQNKVVIQAKPLSFKTDEEVLRDLEEHNERENRAGGGGGFESMESYLDAVKKEPFKLDDGNVILIEPDINIKDKFDQIDLACNKEHRINNTFNAPMKTPEQIQREILLQQQLKLQQKAPQTNKQYDTDTDGDEEEYMRSQRQAKISGNKNNLDFNDVLKQWGVNDLNKLIGGVTSESDTEKAKKAKKNQTKKQNKEQSHQNDDEEEIKEDKNQNQNERSAQSRVGMIQQIMEENRRAQAARQNKDSQPTSMEMMMSSLQELSQDTHSKSQQKPQNKTNPTQAPVAPLKQQNLEQPSEEDSDVAPMSSLVDLPSEEELKEKERKRIEKSLKMASSASEDESANESNRKSTRTQAQNIRGKSNLTDSDAEQIDTSSNKQHNTTGKARKVITYKGIRVNSDSEQDFSQDEDKKSSKSNSKKKPAQKSQITSTQGNQKLTKEQIQERAKAAQRVTNTRAQNRGSPNEDDDSDSDDSADDYFNQQRKMIRNKILNNKDALKEFDKEDVASVKSNGQDDQDDEEDKDERNWDEDMEDFDSLMDQSLTEAQKIQEDEARKAQEEQERIRVERLRKQEEMIKQEQEKKRKERDDLMDRLKRQDEERKKRKKDEKDRKDKEREFLRQQEEERYRLEQEEQERQEEIVKKAKAEENKKLKEKLESERRKENLEKSIRKIWNGSDIPCLFDSKIAYSNTLYSLPVELEQSIRANNISYEDLKFRRYKTLILPIDGLLSQAGDKSLIELISYFLKYSTMKTIDNEDPEGHSQLKNCFPFKCIGLLQTVASPPFNQATLSPVPPSDPNAYRVLSILFDTHDGPRTKNNFTEALKQVQLSSILSQESLKEIGEVFPLFIEDLAQKYFYSNKLKDFPYQIRTEKSPLLEFVNKEDINFDASLNSKETLNRISFFMEYSVQDDVVPISTRESWDFIRRYPTFYAYNPNSRRYTKIDSKGKVSNKFNQFNFENVCVIFKEISNGLVKDDEYYQNTTCRNSIQYFLKKALIKNGLELSGLRMIYLDQDQSSLYEHLFNEKLESTNYENYTQQGLLAMFIRGVDAVNKCENIIGHFNPQSGRATSEKSVRALFGKNRKENCTLKMFASQKKNLSEQIFWFGGRVQQEVSYNDQNSQVPISTMYLVVPPRIEKQYLFLSPLITSRELPQIIAILCNQYGISILDIQKINYPKFQYQSNQISNLNRHLCFFKIRGNVYNVEVGYVLKIARESLSQKMKIVSMKINKEFENYSRTFGEIFYVTANQKDYKISKQKLKQTQFNMYLQHYQDEYSKTSNRVGTDYDTEDPDNYREINLFNEQPKSPQKFGNNKFLSDINAKNIKSTQNANQLAKLHDSYETQTFLCFLKLSLFKKQNMSEILSAITRICGFEVLGTKIVDTKREIYSELVPKEVRHIFKSVAFKFYEVYPELKLRKKISEFKTLVLVLRGRHVEANLSKIYDREKLRFISDIGLYETIPLCLFLTNQKILDSLFDFILNTKIIKLYNDFSHCYEHFMDSPIYSYMLNHNVEKLDPVLIQEAEEKLVRNIQGSDQIRGIDENIDLHQVLSIQNIVWIKNKDSLIESQSIGQNSKLSACLCVIKPNQPFNVALRTLKSIANNQELNLSIQNIEITRYNETQLSLLFKHDILFDENIPDSAKEKMREQYYQLFEQAKNPVIQFIVSGPYAITKMQEIIGQRNPKQAKKDSLRSFYGVDRVDNAYFISENFSESLIERDYLFTGQDVSTHHNMLFQEGSRNIRALNPPSVLSSSTSQLNNSILLSSNHQELALLLISPTLVQNNDFVFVLEDLVRSKFVPCALYRLQLEQEDISVLFTSDVTPRFYNMEVLTSQELSKGPSIIVVVEREKAVGELQDLIGKFEIKSKADFEKTKKKPTQTAFSMFNYGNEQPSTLIQEYGSYLYTFPNVIQNQKKILRFFSSLPNSQHFVIETFSLAQ